jgi:hypothetical protein
MLLAWPRSNLPAGTNRELRCALIMSHGSRCPKRIVGEAYAARCLAGLTLTFNLRLLQPLTCSCSSISHCST